AEDPEELHPAADRRRSGGPYRDRAGGDRSHSGRTAAARDRGRYDGRAGAGAHRAKADSAGRRAGADSGMSPARRSLERSGRAPVRPENKLRNQAAGDGERVVEPRNGGEDGHQIDKDSPFEIEHEDG